MTAQIHELLILDGKETSLAFYPPIPTSHPRIITHHSDYTGDDEPDWELMTTACWRRYQGTWEIKDSRFYLVRLRGRFRLANGEPLLADWFSGDLRIPEAVMVRQIQTGINSVDERHILIEIENGVVKTRRAIDSSEMKYSENEGSPSELLGIRDLLAKIAFRPSRGQALKVRVNIDSLTWEKNGLK